MGYRSDVAAGIEFPNFKECLEFYALLKASSWDCLVPYAKEGMLSPMSGRDAAYLMFWFSDVKWYPEYDLPTAMREVLELAYTKGYPYRFVRVGEEYDDEEIDEEGDVSALEEMIYIERVARVEVYTYGRGHRVDDPDAALSAL